MPSRRLTELRCPQLPTSSTSPGPALRAFSPCGNPQSNLRCLAAASIRSPPGLPSSRSSLSMPWKRLHAPCRSWPCRRPCRVIATDDLQRSVTELGLPLSRLPTCSRFATCHLYRVAPASAARSAVRLPPSCPGFRLFLPAVHFDRQPFLVSVLRFVVRRGDLAGGVPTRERRVSEA